MPVMTLAQLTSFATQLAQNPLLDASFVSQYVNLAYNQVAQFSAIAHSPLEQIAFASTSTSDNRLGFPTDYDSALGLKLGVPGSWSTATSRSTTWVPLLKQTPPWGDPYQSGDSGQPRAYAEFATWIEMRPSPDSAYSVEMRYTRKISELTASTSTPLLDEQWHWAIALKAGELLGALSDDSSLEYRNQRRYRNYISEMETDQAKRRKDERGAHLVVQRRQR